MTRAHRAGTFSIPSWAAIAGLGVVVVALLGFFITGNPDQSEQASASQTSSTGAPTPTASAPPPSASATPTEEEDEDEEVPRAFVEVFNNTGTSGLAASASQKVQGAGWKVVGEDNWRGSIPETTIYYPDRLESQARLLAEDVGVDRVRPAVDPMKFDRLTLILTSRL